jgi:DNA-binding transcriptional LysR family regulator
MEIRDLEYFLACCQARSFTAAAQEVHIVQSAMSSAIARIEHELGVSLFDRSVTPVALTEHGTVLRASAQGVLDAVQAARDDVAAVGGEVRGTVIVGCTLSTGPLDLGAALAGLRDRHPGIVIQLRQSLTGSAGNLRGVLDGAMDIALIASTAHPRTGQPARGVILTPLVSEPLVFVCPADHPLGGRSSVRVGDLAEENILRFPPGWGVRDTVDQVLGLVSAAIEIADYALMLKLVREGFGTTLMPASAIPDRHPGLLAVPVDDPRLRWSLSAAVSSSRQPTAATGAVLDALRQAAGKVKLAVDVPASSDLASREDDLRRPLPE